MSELIEWEGKTWHHSCVWKPHYPGLNIPDWCRITQEERKANTAAYVPPVTQQTIEKEEWRVKQEALRAQIAAEHKEKNRISLEKLKASHAGEVYDRKKKRWITVEVTDGPVSGGERAEAMGEDIGGGDE